MACINNLILPEENSTVLRTAAEIEDIRARTSLKDRLRDEARKHRLLQAEPPASATLRRAVLYVAESNLPQGWERAVSEKEGFITQSLEQPAGFYVVADPWKLNNELVGLAASLHGAWLLAPRVYMGLDIGPAMKLKPALQTRRNIWISDNFKTECALAWVIILEAIVHGGASCKWQVLATPQIFAAEKAPAPHRQSRSSYHLLDE